MPTSAAAVADGDEGDRGEEQRRVRHATGDGTREQHLKRAALTLAGHRRRREADREDARQRDGDGMDDAQRDGAGQREDVATAELRELLRYCAGVDVGLDCAPTAVPMSSA